MEILEHFRQELDYKHIELKKLDEEILDTLLDGVEDEEPSRRMMTRTSVRKRLRGQL